MKEKLHQNYSKSKPYHYLPLLLIFILLDVLSENVVFHAFSTQNNSFVRFGFFTGLMVLQIICAPFQAAFSDLYCRKNSIIFSLLISFFTLLMLCIYNEINNNFFMSSILILVLIVILKGMAGNTVPLACAGIADTQDTNVRSSFAIASSPFALSYVLLALSNEYLSLLQSESILIFSYGVIIILGWLLFIDIRDKKPYLKNKNNFSDNKIDAIKKYFKKEQAEIISEIKHKTTCQALLAFIFWEISMYSVLVALVDIKIGQQGIATGMMTGYLIGIALLLILKKTQNSTLIKWGYIISSASLLPYFIFFKYFNDQTILTATCYFFHSVGNAFLCPTFFAILASEKPFHQLGKAFGLMDSSDSIALLIASSIVLAIDYFNLGISYVILLSFISFNFSWIFYQRFVRKTR